MALLTVVECAEGEQRGLFVLPEHESVKLCHNLSVGFCQICCLARVSGEIVEFHLAGALLLRLWVRIQVPAHGLPIVHANALLAAVAGRLAIEEWPRGLLPAEQCRREADAVQVCRHFVFAAGQLKQRRQPVLEPGDAVARACRPRCVPCHLTRQGTRKPPS